MKAQERAKIVQAISLLQEALTGVAGTTGGSASVSYPPLTEFHAKLSQFESLANKLEPQIIDLSKAVVKCFGLMEGVIATSVNARKPDEETNAKIQGLFKNAGSAVVDVEKKDKFRDHAKAVRQIINSSFWVFTNSPKVVIESSIEAADYDANKFRKLKVAEHNEWYNSLIAATKALLPYAAENFPMGLSFNFNGSGSWNDLLSGTAPKAASVAPPSAPVPSAPKKQQAPAPAVKPPVKELKGSNWYIQNFSNNEIAFSETEAEMKNSFFIENSKNIGLQIPKSKIKSVMISKCNQVKVLVKDCVSGIEIMGCKNVEIKVLGWCPSISVDSSQDVRVILNGDNKNTDILSCKSSQLIVTHTLPNEDLYKEVTIADQFITRWNPASNKYETKIYDQFL